MIVTTSFNVLVKYGKAFIIILLATFSVVQAEQWPNGWYAIEQKSEFDGGSITNEIPDPSSNISESLLSDKSPSPVNDRIIEVMKLSETDSVKAKAFYEQVKDINSPFNVAERFLLRIIDGKFSAEAGDHAKAIEHMLAAKSLISEIPQVQVNSPLFAQFHLYLADSYVAVGQYEQAFGERKDYQTKYKAHIEAEKERTINTLNEKYETKQKEKENELLENENHLKKLQIQDAERSKAAQQRNVIALICTAVIFFLLIVRQIRIRRILHRLAETDNLTGLLNRGALFKRGQKLIDHAVEHQYELSAVLLDIDNFKHINDNYGHDVGDKVLKIVTALGGETMRSRDVFARLGGEEFVAILPEASLDEAKAIAERFREKMATYDLSELEIKHPLNASFGVVCLNQVAPEFDTLIHAADEAMYSAKKSGRNQVCVYKSNSQ